MVDIIENNLYNLFDQSILAEGGQLKDPAAYVQRINKLLLN